MFGTTRTKKTGSDAAKAMEKFKEEQEKIKQMEKEEQERRRLELIQIGSISNKISGLMGQTINTQMFEPFKNMRVVFQIREIKANLPLGVLSCDLHADF